LFRLHLVGGCFTENQHMTGAKVSIAMAVLSGFAAVYFLPPPWLEPLATTDAVCCAIFAIVARFNTKTEQTTNSVFGALFLIFSLPERPLTKVHEGWALSIFLASAAFLISIALAIIVRANL
jgi:hypothetical protein